MDHKLVYSIARDVTGIPGQERPSPRQEAPEGAAATREAAGRERVLIIAETELGRSLSGLLEQRSVDTACSTSGQAGMERAASESFDGIILQLHLPDMDGRDLLSAIRKRDSTRATPVLAVTTSEDRRTIAGLRIQGFVEEPVRMDQILDSLRRAGLPAGKRRHQKREETTAV
jgi:DNA-binding response OmpR family regulator